LETGTRPIKIFLTFYRRFSPNLYVVQDYAATGLSLKAHPVSFVREQLNMLRVTPTADLSSLKDGDLVKVAGLITVRQRPGTAKGIVFITIEDETGFANLVVWEKVFEKERKVILQSRLFMVEGKVQIEGLVIHVVVKRCFNLTGLLRGLTAIENDNQPVLTLSRADERTAPYGGGSNKGQQQITKQKEAFHKGRNFK
jgi:error-prone DNA polymerase